MAAVIVQSAVADVPGQVVTVTLPSNPAPNNLLVAITIAAAAPVATSFPSGWILASWAITSLFPFNYFWVYYKVAGPNEPSVISLTLPFSGNLSAQLHVWEVSGGVIVPGRIFDGVGHSISPGAFTIFSIGTFIEPNSDTMLFAAVSPLTTTAGVQWSPDSLAGGFATSSLASAVMVIPANTTITPTASSGTSQGWGGIYVTFHVSPVYATVLAGYLPPLYQASTVMQAVLNAQGSQIGLIYSALDSILRQNFVLTADSWGLTLWEQELGIADGSLTLTVVQRQARLLQLMRSQVTPTLAAVTTAIQAYGDGAVLVWEDIPNYLVYVLFVNATGIPTNFLDLEAGVRRMLPAHLNVTYIFGALLWSTWDAHDAALGYLWSEVDILDGGTQGLQWSQHDVWN